MTCMCHLLSTKKKYILFNFKSNSMEKLQRMKFDLSKRKKAKEPSLLFVLYNIYTFIAD